MELESASYLHTNVEVAMIDFASMTLSTCPCSIRVENAADIGDALRKSFARPRFALVDVEAS
jgi:hypothetical protein